MQLIIIKVFYVLYVEPCYVDCRDLSQNIGRMLAALMVGEGVSYALLKITIKYPNQTLIAVGIISVVTLIASCMFIENKKGWWENFYAKIIYPRNFYLPKREISHHKNLGQHNKQM